jgi:DNA repair photolyase
LSAAIRAFTFPSLRRFRSYTGGPFLNTPPRKGQGAQNNPHPRYDERTREACDDGWEWEPGAEPAPTELIEDSSRTILSGNDSPDVPFNRSLNPYAGCAHACPDCYARPSHAYHGMSPGLDFETRLIYKAGAHTLLRDALGRPGYAPEPIALGANTDAYQPIERKLRITRRVLEVLAEARHPVGIITKSSLVLRDLDLLSILAAERAVGVLFSITTLEPELARRLEPRAVAPRRRLEAMRRLTDAGVPCGVLVSPVIPALNDAEIEHILHAAAEAGAVTANYGLLRLPREVKTIFSDWARAHYPDRAERILSLLAQCRRGRLNDPDFGTRMRGTGPIADLIAQRFALAARRLGLERHTELWRLNSDAFRPPAAATGQLRLPLD